MREELRLGNMDEDVKVLRRGLGVEHDHPPAVSNSANFSIFCVVVRIQTSNVDHPASRARLQNRPKDDIHNRRNSGKEQRHQRHDPPQAGHVNLDSAVERVLF